MKTVKKNKSIKRVSDKEAENLVKEKGWKYCPKSVWKKGVRDKDDVLANVPEIKKSKKKKQKNLKKLFGVPQSSSQCDAKYVENPKANTLRDKILGKKK